MVWTKHITAAGKAIRSGDYQEAMAQLQSALVEAEKISPPDRRLARTLNDLAELYSEEQREEQAEACWHRAIELGSKELAADDPEVIRGLDGILSFYYKRKQGKDLEPLVNLALRAYEQGSEYQALTLANIFFMLASLLHMQGETHEAEHFVRLALKLREDLLGEDHIELLHELELLISLQCIQGNYGEAEMLYSRLLKLVESELGKDDLLTATIHQSMASMYASQGKHREAEQSYQSALQIIDQYAQAEDYLVPLLERYSAFLRSANRINEAEALEFRKEELTNSQNELS